ncbi:MAG: T9SS type A sorting domain-containing protein [Flavobacteriales bacterium]|nr:T9SS type A sorting domain-containing protein [Flavobacteriales bacterium]
MYRPNSTFRILLATLLLAFATSVSAQNEHFCTSVEKLELLKKIDPAKYKSIRDQATKHQAEAKHLELQKIAKPDTIYVIPIVFHIIHNGGEEKISEAQVLDAMRILNEDFNALSPDTVDVDPLFWYLYANIGFEFRLAQIDPDGNCTNGIIYYQHPTHYTGGSDATWSWVQNQLNNTWKYDQYLNIYTNVGSSNFTWGPTTDVWSGVMIEHNNVGSIGTGVGNGLWERTLTHEIGHWFNLTHTWGPKAIGEGTPCNQDDGVEDTPNCKGTYGCSSTLNSCDDGPGDLKDMMQNYMDYGCSIMFTEGQKARMLASLMTNKQKNLFTQSNLEKTGTAAPYVYGENTCQDPTLELNVVDEIDVICVGQEIMFNYETWGGVIDSVSWDFTNGTPSTSTMENPSVSFTVGGIQTSTLTIYSGEFEASESIDITVGELGDGISYPFTTTFDDEAQYNEYFTVTNTNNDSKLWERATTVGFSDTTCMRLLNNSSTNGNEDVLWGPLLDLSGHTSTNPFTFKLAYSYTNSKNDKLEIFFSKTCGDTWNKFYNKKGSQLQTMSGVTPNSMDDWREDSFTIPTGYNVADVQFKFVFTSAGGSHIWIDDFNNTLASVANVNVIGRSLNIFPNPISSNSVVSFNLPNEEEEVTIDIYNLLGDKVSSAAYGQLAKGSHQLTLELNNNNLNGIYFIKVRFGSEVVTRKVIKQ